MGALMSCDALATALLPLAKRQQALSAVWAALSLGATMLVATAVARGQLARRAVQEPKPDPRAPAEELGTPRSEEPLGDAGPEPHDQLFFSILNAYAQASS
mmetsp:Transcript_35869/g.83473  ORF Transcript_35869/g.83473 Transcript_35869/m.83473 type:complete len:101 (+) Transcript_35869:40-342(+)